jgi:hypothetical protein
MIGLVAPATHTYARDAADTSTLMGSLKLFFAFSVPRLLTLQFVVFGLWRVSLGALTGVDLAIGLAIAIYWPFQEWFVHAIILHVKPRTVFGTYIDPFFARAHRYHHKHPWVLETTFVPLRVIVPLVPVNIAFWWLITPTWSAACTGITLFTLATLIYEWVHYLTHTAYRPQSAYLKGVYRNHHLHHFKNDKYWHSFTLPPIDTLMGTAPDPRSVSAYSSAIDPNKGSPDTSRDYSAMRSPDSRETGKLR